MFDFWSIAKTYISRAVNLFFLMKFLISYDKNKLLSTSSKDVEEISHFFSQFALRHLLGPLFQADYLFPLYIFEIYSLDRAVTKQIAYNENFVHLQIFSCKCQYLGALGPNRIRTHPLVTNWLSNIPYFWVCEATVGSNRIYLMGWFFLSGLLNYYCYYCIMNKSQFWSKSLSVVSGSLMILSNKPKILSLLRHIVKHLKSGWNIELILWLNTSKDLCTIKNIMSIC